MSTNSEWIVGPSGPRVLNAYPLLSVAAMRAQEAATASNLPPHHLMQAAGLALARLTLAYFPHAQSVWVACGRGNNGGDGLEAAIHLQRWGKSVFVTLPESDTPLPHDANLALERAQQAGLPIGTDPPEGWDCCIDALLGIGMQRPPTGAMQATIEAMNRGNGRIIAADLPSGLHADTGTTLGACVQARATLAMLSLKPGMFTAQGRDFCGDIWLNTLDGTTPTQASAWLNGAPNERERPHTSHKGSFGDVAVVGGDQGMVGAAILAGTAALRSGAGRVYLALLDGLPHDAIFATHPGLMQRKVDSLTLSAMSVVAGCGGGTAIARQLAKLLQEAQHLVLDADALNELAQMPDAESLTRRRARNSTVLTPHPLEAARLLACSTAQVQADRLLAAQTLANRFKSTVVLKGSGSVIASPSAAPTINPTGNARLATAGTGDVLAGLVGSLMAQGLDADEAARQACYRHGAVADQWTAAGALTAPLLAEYL